MTVCPHCGRSPLIDSPEVVLAILAAREGRQLYRTRDGIWVYSNPDGRAYEIAPETVTHLIESGSVRQTYAGVDGCYYLGQTIDVDATVAKRRKTGNRSLVVHVGE